jgi:predicted DNA-binding transcriptional regulator AlpA
VNQKPLVPADTVAASLGVHPADLINLASRGQFPRPIKTRRGNNMFVTAEVHAWLDVLQARIAAADSTAAAQAAACLAAQTPEAIALRRAVADLERDGGDHE